VDSSQRQTPLDGWSDISPEGKNTGEVREQKSGVFKALAALGTTGLVLSLAVFVVPILWGAGDVFWCGVNSYRPSFAPDDYVTYDRPIMCGNDMAWFVVVAPLVAFILSTTASFALLFGARHPRVAVPLAAGLMVLLAVWAFWSAGVVTALRTYEAVPMF
jgi:hypothetical protein